MAFKYLFSPKWKSSWWIDRFESVENLKDKEILEKIAKNDENKNVREAAVWKLDNQELLGDIAKKDASWLVRKAAVWKLEDQELLEELSKNDENEDVRKAATLKNLKDEELFRHIAINDKDYHIRYETVKKLKDLDILSDIAKNDESKYVREAAEETMKKLNMGICFCCKSEFVEEKLKTFYYALGYYSVEQTYIPTGWFSYISSIKKVNYLGKNKVSYCSNCLVKIKNFYNTQLLKIIGILFLSLNLSASFAALAGINENLRELVFIGFPLISIFLSLIILNMIYLIRQTYGIVFHIMSCSSVYKKILSQYLNQPNIKKVERAFKRYVKLYTISSYNSYNSFHIYSTSIKVWKSFPKRIKWEKVTHMKRVEKSGRCV